MHFAFASRRTLLLLEARDGPSGYEEQAAFRDLNVFRPVAFPHGLRREEIANPINPNREGSSIRRQGVQVRSTEHLRLLLQVFYAVLRLQRGLCVANRL